MSSGYCSSFADTITEEQIKKVVKPKTWKAFIKWVDEKHDGLEAFGSSCRYGEYDVDGIENDDPYVDLVKEFEDKTGLNLELGYHNNDDEGDCHDEVNGVYWQTYNAYQLTPEAKKFQKKFGEIERKFWVTYG